jgi:hypothetical protein
MCRGRARLQLPIAEWIDSLRAGIGLVPPALIAIVLLGGPTAGWLLYRFVVQPRTARQRAFERNAYWVCPNCRSVNDFRLTRCYRCDSRPADADLEVIDAQPGTTRRLTPVGPGLDLGGPRRLPRPRPLSSLETQSAGWEQVVEPWVNDQDTWDEELEMDRAALPDVAAMTEVIEAQGRRRIARPPTSISSGPSRPAVARPRRVAVAGQSTDPDDTPAA